MTDYHDNLLPMYERQSVFRYWFKTEGDAPEVGASAWLFRDDESGLQTKETFHVGDSDQLAIQWRSWDADLSTVKGVLKAISFEESLVPGVFDWFVIVDKIEGRKIPLHIRIDTITCIVRVE